LSVSAVGDQCRGLSSAYSTLYRACLARSRLHRPGHGRYYTQHGHAAVSCRCQAWGRVPVLVVRLMDLLLPALFLCQFYWTWQQAAGPCVRACQVHWRFEVGGGIYSDETVGGGMC
jgi:hypothetical protein